jgi:hypothetical protein
VLDSSDILRHDCLRQKISHTAEKALHARSDESSFLFVTMANLQDIDVRSLTDATRKCISLVPFTNVVRRLVREDGAASVQEIVSSILSSVSLKKLLRNRPTLE